MFEFYTIRIYGRGHHAQFNIEEKPNKRFPRLFIFFYMFIFFIYISRGTTRSKCICCSRHMQNHVYTRQ